jgi:hypothetical protein
MQINARLGKSQPVDFAALRLDATSSHQCGDIKFRNGSDAGNFPATENFSRCVGANILVACVQLRELSSIFVSNNLCLVLLGRLGALLFSKKLPIGR